MFCAATSSINKHGPMMDKFTLFHLGWGTN